MDCDRCGNAGTVWGRRWSEDPPAYALVDCPDCLDRRRLRYRQLPLFKEDA